MRFRQKIKNYPKILMPRFEPFHRALLLRSWNCFLSLNNIWHLLFVHFISWSNPIGQTEMILKMRIFPFFSPKVLAYTMEWSGPAPKFKTICVYTKDPEVHALAHLTFATRQQLRISIWKYSFCHFVFLWLLHGCEIKEWDL